MIPTSYLFDQEEQVPQEQVPQEQVPQEQVPQEQPGTLADRIFTRAMDRTVTPEESEEDSVEAQAQEKIDQEKMGAKVGARAAEIADKDVELKQLKAATAALTKKSSEDTSTMEKGMIPDSVQQDKIENDAEAKATQQGPPEGNSQGQVAESLNDYI